MEVEERFAEVRAQIVAFTDSAAVLLPDTGERGTGCIIEAVTSLGGSEENSARNRTSSKAEREAKECQRLQLEEQAQRDLQKSNDAVNEVSKKLGRKPPTLDLGLPPEKKAEPTPPPEPAKKP